LMALISDLPHSSPASSELLSPQFFLPLSNCESPSLQNGLPSAWNVIFTLMSYKSESCLNHPCSTAIILAIWRILC
jgi:hypothetical protein